MIQDHEDAIASCERTLKARGAAKDTFRAVLGFARRFLAKVEKRVAEIDKGDVRAFLADESRRGLSKTTLAATVVRLRIFFQTLKDGGLISTDPTEGFLSRSANTPPQLTLSSESVTRLMLSALDVPLWGRPCREVVEALALRDRALVELLYGLGVRRSEAGAARLTDLRLKDGSIFVRRLKGGEGSVLPLPRSSLEPLRRYVSEGRPVLVERAWKKNAEDYLFLSWSGAPLLGTGVYQVVRRLTRRTGVEATPHSFRRGLATHMIREGINVEAVRQVLGHKKLETTAIYAQVDREDMRKAVATLERRTAGSPA